MKSSAPLLALVAGALAHGSLGPRQSHPHNSDIEGFRIRKRVAAGGKCGPGAGSCSPGLCCSEGGVCGTGGEFCAAPACQLSYGPACDGNQVPKGADTSKTPRPTLGSLPVGVDITSCKVMGKIALTFDDGPYIYTSELLDLLKRNNVRATFFIVGNNGAKGMINDPSSGYTPIVQRMISDGHQVASHSWSHQDLEASTPAQRRAQIINNEIAIADILGVIPTYFRPPYTSCEGGCYGDLGALGYRVVNYDVDPKDWEFGGVNAKSIYQSAISQGSPANRAYLALAHDIQEFTVKDFAQFMIDKARALGYELVTAGECLGDDPSNWYRDPVTGQGKALNGKPVPPPPTDKPTSASSTGSKTSSPSSSTKPSSTPTPKVVAPGTDFGLGKSSVNSTSQRSSSSSSSSSTLSPSGSSTSGSPAAQQSKPPTSLGSRTTTVGRSMFGGNELFAFFLGLLGLLVFALN